MFLSKWMRVLPCWVVIALSFSGTNSAVALAQKGRKFTVAEEIGLTILEDAQNAVQFSPDGRYFAVYSERGIVDLNCVEDSLRFYESRNVKGFLDSPDRTQFPSPIWTITRTAADDHGIKNWRWLLDSTGVAFLEPTSGDNQRLVLADLQKKTIEPLTFAKQRVEGFDIHDKRHYVYILSDPVDVKKTQAEHRAPVILATGRKISDLILQGNSHSPSSRKHLWAVLGGKPFEVKNHGVPLAPVRNLALSPDGSSLVTALWVPEVPLSWETLYPPWFPSFPYQIHSGRQDPNSTVSLTFMHQYVLINLKTGSFEALTDAPTSYAAGWFASGDPSWSNDGLAVLLPGTFIKPRDNAPSRPCVAVVEISSRASTCVETLKRHTETGVEEGYHTVNDARFIGGEKDRVRVTFYKQIDSALAATEYLHAISGAWKVVKRVEKMSEGEQHDGLEITIAQDLNRPPLLVATDRQKQKVIWDPNPQLKNMELGEASVYKWKDKDGQEREAGLYRPVNYEPGQRYPLVIQTHGFAQSKFRPSGLFTTAFAARALAAAGIAVLQVGPVGNCGTDTPDEGRCTTSGYETVVNQLVSDGLADPDRIGIIGFSRTCFHVMETLTEGSIHIKAASITDGFMVDYLQYILFDAATNESDAIIGAKPFGAGLQRWLEESPGFNLDKINAPLLVVGEGPLSLLSMWLPYAGLRDLHKPVEIMMLNSDKHILLNPSVRLASQGGSVDWFRFWLKGEEDPDPAKGEQYARWRDLRKLQEVKRNTK